MYGPHYEPRTVRFEVRDRVRYIMLFRGAFVELGIGLRLGLEFRGRVYRLMGEMIWVGVSER